MQNILDRIESRIFTGKVSCTVAGTICKAFPVVGMMGNFQTFTHSTEENGVAAWNVTGTQGMITNRSRNTRGFAFPSLGL